MLKRAISGVVYLVVIVGGMLLGPHWFVAVYGFITVACLWEFYRLFNLSEQLNINLLAGCLAGLYLFLAGALFFSGSTSSRIFVPWLLYPIVLMLMEIRHNNLANMHRFAYSLFGQLYVALPLTLLSRIAFHSIDGSICYRADMLICLLVFVSISDTMAYVVGSLFGKHKLLERISPKKTWEGFFGGLVSCLLVTIGAQRLLPDLLSLPAWIGFALVAGLSGVCGDLFESLLKRTANVKDSGSLLPGHGGLLDRMDSFLFATPALVVYFFFVFQGG